MKTTGGIINLSLITATNVLVILPLAAFVSYVSLQRRRQSSRFTASHSDHFTYHTICDEVLNFSGLVIIFYGITAEHKLMVAVGLYVISLSLFSNMLIDTLTCAERYLAVVHPVTYRNLKNAKGVWIRNSAIGGCWLLAIVVAGVLLETDVENMFYIVLSFTGLLLLVVSFCSLCVLFALVRPGPGEGGEVKKVNQSKLRAFYIILIILVVMVTRLIANVLIDFMYTLVKLKDIDVCDLIHPFFWSGLPSGVISFVLFLQKEGKLCCKSNKV